MTWPPFAGKNYYAWGTNPPPASTSESLGNLSKSEFQMTRYGTWH